MPLTGPGKKSILAQCRLSNLQLQPIQPPRPFPLRRLSLVRPTCPLDTGTLTWFFCGNKNFLRFWLAGVISQLGNWFNYIAIFVLLNELTGSGAAVSWFLIAKFMPTAILAPVSGVIADRFSRRKIMIFCDVSRIFVVLGFLLVREPGQVWLIFALALLQESIWSFYDPARRAAVPNICRPEELHLANVLSGATWSIMLAVGVRPWVVWPPPPGAGKPSLFLMP